MGTNNYILHSESGIEGVTLALNLIERALTTSKDSMVLLTVPEPELPLATARAHAAAARAGLAKHEIADRVVVANFGTMTTGLAFSHVIVAMGPFDSTRRTPHELHASDWENLGGWFSQSVWTRARPHAVVLVTGPRAHPGLIAITNAVVEGSLILNWTIRDLQEKGLGALEPSPLPAPARRQNPEAYTAYLQWYCIGRGPGLGALADPSTLHKLAGETAAAAALGVHEGMMGVSPKDRKALEQWVEERFADKDVSPEA